ncbi:MAG: lipid-transfer protein [Candidatus Dormibacteria bacterium]
MSRRAAVIGVGETRYSRRSPSTALQLQLEASLTAIDDAGLAPTDIDGVIPIGITGATAEHYVTNFGITDLRFSAVIPHGGASPIGALQCAAAAVATGLCSNVLVAAGRNVSGGARAGVRIHQMPQFHLVSEFERPVGAIAPAQLYAPMARRHMELYGTRREEFGEIAVSTREHALRQDNAIMTTPMTLEDHHRSRMITDPFRLFDCSLESDGGAAFVVSSVEHARDLRQPVVALLGAGMGHPDSPSSITQRNDLTRVGVHKAAARVFEMAGVGHADIDVAEIYDCFTFIVLCQLEDLGFCAKGEGGDFVSGGRLRPGGQLPTNTHGGLLSQAHMLGMNHVVELVRQLRGQGGRAQVPAAEVGLVSGYGDQGDGGVAIMARM